MWAARDVREPLDHLLKENRIGGVVHLAYVLRPSHDHRRVRSINVGGTENLIAACEAAGASVMVYPSSTTVYGAHRDYERPYLETDSPRPVAGFQYSEDKAEAERLLLDFSARRGTRVAVLRAPPVMGQSADNFIVRSLTRRWLPSPSGVDVEFQFLHLDDLLDALVLALRSQSQGIYNISGSGTVRWREMARAFGNHVFPVPGSLLRAATGLSWALRLQSESPACGVDFIRYPWLADCSKITRELGWRPRYSSEQALQAARPAIGIPQ
jgi:UDP-glucose 4-epimerase